MPHAIVSDRQRSRAKSLRLTMTRAETLLWRYIKAGHIDGLQFRRQSPMGAYIVDFVCHAAKLVIEVDGDTHDFESRLRRDEIRDRWLASRGYKVLRFTNAEVLSTLEGVVTVIHETASQRLKAPPSLSLPRKGGGNPQTSTARDAARRRAPSLPSPASGGGGENGASGGRGQTAPSLNAVPQP